MISVVVPTLNGGEAFIRLMEALRTQSVPAEILVVDSSSTDGTGTQAEARGARIITVRREDFDHGGTRNLGLRAAAGDPVVFMTQDALPVDNRLIENLTAPLEDRTIAYCYGRQIARPDATPPERFTRAFNYPEVPVIKGKAEIATLGIKAFFCSNVCAAVRREAFETVGGFPERIISNEDMILAGKLIVSGYRVAYQPLAAVHHSHRYSLVQQFQRYFDIGVSLNRNRQILETTGPDREGRRFLRSQISSLARQQAWVWIPYVCAQALAKYAGFRLGLSEDRIPWRLRRLLSMHKHFWLKYNRFLHAKEDL